MISDVHIENITLIFLIFSEICFDVASVGVRVRSGSENACSAVDGTRSKRCSTPRRKSDPMEYPEKSESCQDSSYRNESEKKYNSRVPSSIPHSGEDSRPGASSSSRESPGLGSRRSRSRSRIGLRQTLPPNSLNHRESLKNEVICVKIEHRNET